MDRERAMTEENDATYRELVCDEALKTFRLVLLRDGGVDPVTADHTLLGVVQQIVHLLGAQIVDRTVEDASSYYQRNLPGSGA